MTLVIDITPQLEARLRRIAERQGRNEAEIALLAVEQYLRAEEAPLGDQTVGAQMLSELEAEGILGLWQDRAEDTAALAREFRSDADARGSGG